jgi:hypothetical protein
MSDGRGSSDLRPTSSPAAFCPPEPEIVATARNTGLVWALKDSFVSYAQQVSARVELGGGAGQLSGGAGFYFPVANNGEFDHLALAGTLRFAGQLRIVGHKGLLDVGVFDPWLAIANGHGRLSVRDRRTSAPDDARIDLVEVVLPVPTCDGRSLMWTDARTELASSGTHVFDENYCAGERFASVSIRVQATVNGW